jgi:hypothetical protein
MMADGFIRSKSQFLGSTADILATETADISRLSPENYSNLKLRGGKKNSDKIFCTYLTFRAKKNY